MELLQQLTPPLVWPSALRELRWFRIRQLWAQTFAAARIRETPHAIVQAILKQAAITAGLDPSSQLLFDLPRTALGSAFRLDHPFPVS